MTINGTGSGSGWAGGYDDYDSEGTTTDSTAETASGYAYYWSSSGWDNATDTNGYGYQEGWDETYSYGWGGGSQSGGGTASGSNTDDSGSSWGWTRYSGGAWYSGSGSGSTSSSGSYSESISSPGFYGGGLNWSPFATGGQGLGYGMSAPGVTVEPDAEGSGNLWSRGGADMGEEIGTMSDALMEGGGSSSPSGSSPGAEGNEGEPGETGLVRLAAVPSDYVYRTPEQREEDERISRQWLDQHPEESDQLRREEAERDAKRQRANAAAAISRTGVNPNTPWGKEAVDMLLKAQEFNDKKASAGIPWLFDCDGQAGDLAGYLSQFKLKYWMADVIGAEKQYIGAFWQHKVVVLAPKATNTKSEPVIFDPYQMFWYLSYPVKVMTFAEFAKEYPFWSPGRGYTGLNPPSNGPKRRTRPLEPPLVIPFQPFNNQ